MTSEEMIERLGRRPYQPFRLRMTDGRVYDLREPALVRVTPTCALVFFPDPTYPPPACDHMEVAALDSIAAVEPLGNSASTPV